MPAFFANALMLIQSKQSKNDGTSYRNSTSIFSGKGSLLGSYFPQLVNADKIVFLRLRDSVSTPGQAKFRNFCCRVNGEEIITTFL